MSNPPSNSQTIATIVLNYGGRQYPIRFPESAEIRAELAKLFRGEEYPLLPLPGWTPSVIVDVGANIGDSALYFHLAYPQAELYGFEPSPRSAALMKENLAFSEKCHAMPYGLMDEAATIKLFINTENNMKNSVIQSVDVSSTYESAEVREAGEELRRLGIEKISVLKIDTEGCEVPILRSITAWLERTDLIYVEYHSDEDRREIDRMLSEHFILAYGYGPLPHRGMNLFVSRRIVGQFPHLDRMKLDRPGASA